MQLLDIWWFAPLTLSDAVVPVETAFDREIQEYALRNVEVDH